MGLIQIALAPNADNARRVLHPFNCDASLAVGDLVYVDPANENKVLKPASNLLTEQIIGVCYQKPSDELCKVMLLGVMDGYESLTTSGRIFLSESGGITQSRPSNAGYEHILGLAVSQTEILFIPNNIRVKRTT